MSRKQLIALCVLAVCLVLAGCTPHTTPKLIEADGTTYVACRGIVWVESKSGLLGGETTYEVTFTDSDGADRDIRGIKHLAMTDLQPWMPQALPSGKALPSDKAPEGTVRYWADGSRITFRNGSWVYEEPNPYCAQLRGKP